MMIQKVQMQIFSKAGLMWAFLSKRYHSALQNNTFLSKGPAEAALVKKIAFWLIRLSSRHSHLHFELKILGMAPKLSLQSMGHKSDAFHFFDTFMIKGPPKSPALKKLHLDLLDHQVNTQLYL